MVTAGIEYFNPVVVAQTPVDPLMFSFRTGLGGFIVTAILRSVPVPQSLEALTLIEPEPEFPAVTTREGVVVVKFGAEKPEGKVQM